MGGCNFQEFSERRSASCFPTGRRRRRAPRRSSDKRGRDPRRTPAHARTYWAARTRVRAHQLRRSDSTHDVTRGPNSALLPVHVRVHAQRDGLLLPVRARLLLLGVLAVRRAPAHPVRSRSWCASRWSLPALPQGRAVLGGRAPEVRGRRVLSSATSRKFREIAISRRKAREIQTAQLQKRAKSLRTRMVGYGPGPYQFQSCTES